MPVYAKCSLIKYPKNVGFNYSFFSGRQEIRKMSMEIIGKIVFTRWVICHDLLRLEFQQWPSCHFGGSKGSEKDVLLKSFHV